MERPDRRLAAGLGLGAFLLYLATLCPSVYIGDAGELVAAAWCFGVAHPPGYPLYTLLYGLGMRALPFADVALRANLITAALAAAAVAVTFLAARRLGVSRGAAAAAAVGLVVVRQFWMQAVSVEVYALDALLLALALYAALAGFGAAHATGDTPRSRDARAPRPWLPFAVLGLCYGLAAGHRPVNLIYLAPLLVWVELRRRALHRPARGWLALLAGVAVSGLPFLYLPLAAAANPPMNMGDPDSLHRLWAVITAQPHARHLRSTTAALTFGRLGEQLVSLPGQLGVGLLAALAGALALGRRQLAAAAGGRGFAVVLGAAILLNVGFASSYNILDNDGYYQPLWLALALLAAVGFHVGLARWGGGPPGRRRLLLAAALALAALPALWTWKVASLRGVDLPDRYSRDLLASAAPGALVLVNGDTPRASLAYQQVAMARRRDVAVLSPRALHRWHIEEARRRSPGFDLPALGPGEDPLAWLRRVVTAQLARPGGAVYLSELGTMPLPALLGPELAARAELLPTGLLYRLWLRPAGLDPSPPAPGTPPDPALVAAAQARRRLLQEADAAFWPGRRIPRLATARADPQLQLLVVHYAMPRFLLAVEHASYRDRPRAEAHLRAVAASDADQREAAVARANLAIGRRLRPRRFVARAAAALDALERGAPPSAVLRALSGS